MSDTDAELVPTVTLRHRYGEQQILANRADYVREKDGRFANWLLAEDDPELTPPVCASTKSVPAPVRNSAGRRRRRRRR